MISVVIPLYNKERSIERTIQSVLHQSYTDYELIVVNDGSTDRSLDVAERLAISDERIRVIHQENGGVSSARNRGIMEAKGEYVCLLDGDDLWDTEFLMEMERLITDYPGKSIYGLESRKVSGDVVDEIVETQYYRGEAQWNWSRMAFYGSSCCVNKQDAIAVGLFDTRMTHGEDLDMWWRLLLRNGGACYTKPYSYYRQDAENRAMHKEIPLERFIPYYIDKYQEDRKMNAEFRRFFDQEMVHRLYPYLFDERYKREAMRLGRKLDYKQLKFTLWFRMICPHIYRFITKR